MPRGSAPGERRGGRQKGSPNRKTLEVADKLRKLGCDPIEGMAKIAQDPSAGIDLRARMFAELAQYVAPKRKATEHTGAGGGPVKMQITWLTAES